MSRYNEIRDIILELRTVQKKLFKLTKKEPMMFLEIEMYHDGQVRQFNVDFGINLVTGILTNTNVNLREILKRIDSPAPATEDRNPTTQR